MKTAQANISGNISGLLGSIKATGLDAYIVDVQFMNIR